MVKVAKKYTTAFRPLLLNDETKCALPVWQPIGVEKGKGFTNNNQWAKCQRENHKINTVSQMRDSYTKKSMDIVEGATVHVELAKTVGMKNVNTQKSVDLQQEIY